MDGHVELLRREIGVRPTDRDEWTYRARANIGRLLTGGDGYSTPTSPPGTQVFSFGDYGSLKICKREGEGTYEVVVLGPDSARDLIGAAGEIIDALHDQLGQDLQDFRWEATIRQEPGAFAFAARPMQRLIAGHRTPTLEVRDLGRVYQELHRGEAMDMGVTASPYHYWPIEIGGVTRHYDWMAGGYAAAAASLTQVAAVLSLAWEAPWNVLLGPRLDGSRFSNEIGPESGILGHSLDPDRFVCEEDGKWTGWGHWPVQVPDWFDITLNRMSNEGRLRDAVLAHHQALLLVARHPSFSLVAFVASIERGARLSKQVDRCATCKSPTGITEHFKRTVARHLPPGEAVALGEAYGRYRSRTVHDGKLHGSETDFFAWSASIFSGMGSAIEFGGLLSVAAKASRSIIFNLIGD